MVCDAFDPYGLPDATIAAANHDLHEKPSKLSSFLMTFHHELAAPSSSRAYVSALTLALGYFAGGFIPLIPYFCVKRHEVFVALYWSIGIMAITLLVFGYVKTGIVRGWSGKENIVASVKGGVEMLVVGGIAAGAAIGLVRAIDHGAYQL
jgi:VIT1/CCC1 family predicted Fe2+/Mn2+ transporter